MSSWRSLRFEFQAMASACSLQIDGVDEQHIRQAAALAVAEVHRIEQKYSRYRPDSVTSVINAGAGTQWVEIDAETSSLLDYAGQLWDISGGLFDITSGILRRAWDFRVARLPEEAQLQKLLPCIGWNQVERRPGAVRWVGTGRELDFGGFGKEYAADRAAAVLAEQGCVHALVNLGGDLHALGPRGLPESFGAPWHIDIQHPRPDPAQPLAAIAQIALSRGGLATSGDYERFLIHDGKRYCHILNPHTGWPVHHWQSVSVLASNTSGAGALSTIAMLKGEGASQWLQTQGVRYLTVGPDGQLAHGG